MLQEILPREVILIDDASNDGTLDELKRLLNIYSTSRVKFKLLVLHKNLGVASARNAGWAEADGCYVAFLDADDSWHPKKLMIQLEVMKQFPSLLLTGHEHVVTKTSNWSSTFPSAPTIKFINFQNLLWRNQFTTSSIVMRSFSKQRFETGSRHMEDHRLLLELAASGYRLAKIQMVLVAHHKPDFGAAGLSGNLLDMESAELSNYWYFYNKGSIRNLQFLVLCVWSLVKFMRRCLIVGFRFLKF
jgi:glycosyltransferase involved in cell wall biosynthesis